MLVVVNEIIIVLFSCVFSSLIAICSNSISYLAKKTEIVFCICDIK